MSDQMSVPQMNWNDEKLTHGMMFLYKTRLCPAFDQNQCKFGIHCFDSHGQVCRRRPSVNVNGEWNYSHTIKCSKGYASDSDNCHNVFRCRYSHDIAELNYHPLEYKTHPCTASIYMRFTNMKYCPRGAWCWQYHDDDRRDMIKKVALVHRVAQRRVVLNEPPPQQYLDWCVFLQSSRQIIIKPIYDEKTITLDVRLNESIQNIKKQIQHKNSIPTEQQTLIFAGRMLDDCKTLIEVTICPRPTIYLRVPRSRVNLNPAPYIDDSETFNDTKQIREDLSEIKSSLKQIIAHITQQEKKLEQFIMKTRNDKQLKEVKEHAIDDKCEFLIDGYLRAFYADMNMRFDIEISRLVCVFYQQNALKDEQNDSNIINDIDLWNVIKTQHINNNELDVNTPSEYLMIQNPTIFIKNKTLLDTKKLIISLLIKIGVELDEIDTNDRGEFQLRYHKGKKYLFAQMKMKSSDAARAVVEKFNKRGEKKWLVRQWINHKNRSKRKPLRNQIINNNKQQNTNQNANQNTNFIIPSNMPMNSNISGVLPLNYNYGLRAINYAAYPFPNIASHSFYSNNQ